MLALHVSCHTLVTQFAGLFDLIASIFVFSDLISSSLEEAVLTRASNLCLHATLLVVSLHAAFDLLAALDALDVGLVHLTSLLVHIALGDGYE